jgi:hypothetical protein
MGLTWFPIGRLNLHPDHGGLDLLGRLGGAGGLRGIRIGFRRAGFFPTLGTGGKQQGKGKG